MLDSPTDFLRLPPASSLLEKRETVDIRTPEAFASAHLEGSTNCCVYEVAFSGKFENSFPERTTPLLICGEDANHRGADLAAERIAALGYKNIAILEGGIAAAVEADLPIIGNYTPENHGLPEGSYELDPEASRIQWTGRNLFNQHTGGIPASSGHLRIEGGQWTDGWVELDMNQLTCDDLTDPEANAGLIGHLQHDDFFAVKRFPTAAFQLTGVSPKRSRFLPGTPNLSLHGNITIRGITQDFSTDATVGASGGRVAIHAAFSFDRTDFGARYGSSRFFERLGMHLVHNDVLIDMRLVYA